MTKKFDNQAKYIKYKVLKEVIRSNKNGSLAKDILYIPEKIIPGPEAETRCCIYKERAIISDRIKNVIEDNKEHVVNVIDLACDECPLYRFSVTEACRGCLAHHCRENCPAGAIEIINKRAHINQDKCLECGRCAAVCPFEAISDVKRPCRTICKTGALSFDQETKKSVIDYSKCTNCGACVSRCPFGAIADKSHIMEIMKMLDESINNTKYKVYCIVAPAVAAQYPETEIENVVTAIKKLGFYEVVEAAVGADMVADYETKLLEKELKHKKFITSSCCPAFVSYIKIKYPELKDNISTAVSPMIATSRLIRSKDPEARIVFVGPCVAKKAEINQDNLKGEIQYTMSFEELTAFLDAYGINPVECEASTLDNVSYYARIFARAGGVTESIKNTISVQGLGFEFRPIICDGIEECDKALKMAKSGKLNGNFIEGMACRGGCVNGPVSMFKKHTGADLINSSADKAKGKHVRQTYVALDKENLNMEV
ncbi:MULTISPECIES: 4Fe-4S dicluster domain-containing protein [unclassified Sedimentibacter]|uniref:4Fe-4S dicluster domain-containing protein n=1 Tax=unclassified Sedimentibacter TaxID=2649220 RepID=UPI0027E06D5F|nr:4Fe-4S dicluster domain-containing protein [Sedimentibacter sp. MB35-C1]WMJ75993.1 4Fe-4S dicluster domain-containing protein [Sedimentibacter sp. MB35-C1]